MCLLKVYVENEKTGSRELIAGNVALLLMENGHVRLLNIDNEEKIVVNADLSFIDALNSIAVLRVHGDF
jgi:hypothetical protein